jgi:hypothetical protein
LVAEQASLEKLMAERAALRQMEMAELERETRVSTVGLPAIEGLTAFEVVAAQPVGCRRGTSLATHGPIGPKSSLLRGRDVKPRRRRRRRRRQPRG